MSEYTPKIPTKDEKEVQSLVSIVDEYRNFDVTSVDDCQHAADILGKYKTRLNDLEERRKLITKPLDDAKKSVMDLFRPAADAIKTLEGILKPKIVAFQRKQEEEQRRLQAEAEAKARKERERLEKRAEQAREKGQEEKAAALEQQAVTTVAAAPAVVEQKVSGISSRKTWKAKVTDVRALCKAIADGDIPASVIDFKQSELDRFAATWQNSKDFPGIQIYQDTTIATRR